MTMTKSPKRNFQNKRQSKMGFGAQWDCLKHIFKDFFQKTNRATNVDLTKKLF